MTERSLAWIFIGAGVGMLVWLVVKIIEQPTQCPPPLTCTCSCQDDVAILEIREPTTDGK